MHETETQTCNGLPTQIPKGFRGKIEMKIPNELPKSLGRKTTKASNIEGFLRDLQVQEKELVKLCRELQGADDEAGKVTVSDSPLGDPAGIPPPSARPLAILLGQLPNDIEDIRNGIAGSIKYLRETLL